MSAAPTVQHPPAEGSPFSNVLKERRIRPDIEGLRAVAIGSLMAAHAGVPFLAGGFVGVDIFFVIAGFLLTGLLVREITRPGTKSLATFWAGRVRRVVPAGTVVLAFSALATYLYLPVEQRKEISGDIVSSALYVVNWRLADHGADRWADAGGQSPVQHWWSIAVGAQVLLAWSIVLFVIGLVAARRWRPVAVAVMGVATIGSFLWSQQQMSDDPGAAFFTSTARAWEIGVGALLALLVTQVTRLPGMVRAAGGWVGVALIAYAVLVFDESTTWPGAAALVPTVGAVLLIAAGLGPAPASPQRLLSFQPLVWIGGLAYALYLWHWPILVVAEAERPEMRLRFVVVLMILTIVPAYLTRKLVENPLRFGAPWRGAVRGLSLGAALTAVGVGVGMILTSTVATGEVVDRAATSDALGAAALLVPANQDVVWSDIKAVDKMRPLPAAALKDRPPVYDEHPDCQLRGGESTPRMCSSGDLAADRTLLLVGDSKIVQWITPIEKVAEVDGWRVIQMTKSACPLTDANNGRSNEADCRTWGKLAVEKIIQLDPDLVITSHRRGTAENTEGTLTEPAMADGIVRLWQKIRDAGIPLAVILDNPQPSRLPVYECVVEHPRNLSTCAYDEAQGVKGSGAPAQRDAARRVGGVGVIDMTDVICPDNGRCPAVIGNVLVYRNGTHLTRTFVDSATTQLADRLAAATDGLFGVSE